MSYTVWRACRPSCDSASSRGRLGVTEAASFTILVNWAWHFELYILIISYITVSAGRVLCQSLWGTIKVVVRVA